MNEAELIHPFPGQLSAHSLQPHPGHPRQVYLFESGQHRAYSPRRVQQLVKEYQKKAGIVQNIYPHLFRHQMLTWLTKRGLSDTEIQLISGHSSNKSLEMYQHIGLESVDQDIKRRLSWPRRT